MTNSPKGTGPEENRLWRIGNLVLGASLLVFILAQCVIAESRAEETWPSPHHTADRIPD